MSDYQHELYLLSKMDQFTCWRYCNDFQLAKGMLNEKDAAYVDAVGNANYAGKEHCDPLLFDIAVWILDLTEDDSIPYITAWLPSSWLYTDLLSNLE